MAVAVTDSSYITTSRKLAEKPRLRSADSCSSLCLLIRYCLVIFNLAAPTLSSLLSVFQFSVFAILLNSVCVEYLEILRFEALARRNSINRENPLRFKMQRMVDLELESAGFETTSQPQLLDHEESLKEQPLPASNKQNSVFSLTFDEIQRKSGKSFGNMSMDEFLASVWNVEDNQVSLGPNKYGTENDKFIAAKTNLSRQGSFSIPIPLCCKTVDEVWSEIHNNQSRRQIPDNSINRQCQSQQSLGEITLEDFLIKAGVVQESIPRPCVYKSTPMPSENFNFSNHKSLDVNYQMISTNTGLGFSDRRSTARKITRNGFAPYEIATQNGGIFGEPFDYSAHDKSNGLADLIRPKNTRIVDGPPEVVVQRRQRRMIKNRESAARSRARKLAYTVELEVELNQLKEENEKLKQVVAEAEGKRREEIMQQKQTTKAQKQAEKLKSIRRIVSVTW